MSLPLPVKKSDSPEPEKECNVAAVWLDVNDSGKFCECEVHFRPSGDKCMRTLMYLVSEYGYRIFDTVQIIPNRYKFMISPVNSDYFLPDDFTKSFADFMIEKC